MIYRALIRKDDTKRKTDTKPCSDCGDAGNYVGREPDESSVFVVVVVVGSEYFLENADAVAIAGARKTYILYENERIGK